MYSPKSLKKLKSISVEWLKYVQGRVYRGGTPKGKQSAEREYKWNSQIGVRRKSQEDESLDSWRDEVIQIFQ